MPVGFLSDEQIAGFGHYVGMPSEEDLAKYFYLDEADHELVARRRGPGLRLGFAVQLCTLRYLGTMLDDCDGIPGAAIEFVAKQIRVDVREGLLADYWSSRQRQDHAREIQKHFGYVAFTNELVGFRITRWLYAINWTGTERPSALFDRAATWLLQNKVILPGVSQLERFIARLRQRVETRLWRILCDGVTLDQRTRLDDMLSVAPGERTSKLDQLRSGPTIVSSLSLVKSIGRLQAVRNFEVKPHPKAEIPHSRLAAMARYANTSKAVAVARLPMLRRVATLVAFVHTLEATAQDDAIDVLEQLLHTMFGEAMKADQKSRLRSIKDLDEAATVLANACMFVLDEKLPSSKLRAEVFDSVGPDELALALSEVLTLVRPPDDVFYRELLSRYKRVRRYLPAILEHIRFGSGTAGKDLVDALNYLKRLEDNPKQAGEPPLAIVSAAWRKHVQPDGTEVDKRAYLFCALDRLRHAIKRREVFWLY